jgi:hypothetical protein
LQATRTAIAGVASFDTLVITALAGTGKTLTATSGTFSAVSRSFTIVPNPIASRLKFMQQPPAFVQPGAPLTPSVNVEALDVAGNRVTTYSGVIAIGISGTPISGTPTGQIVNGTIKAVQGLATFPGLILNFPVGSKRNLWAAEGAISAPNSTLVETVAVVQELSFLRQPPVQAAINTAIRPTVQVQVLDSYKRRLTTFNGTITLSAGTTPMSGTTLTAINGIASFSNLKISTTSTSISLKATAASCIPVNSYPFVVTSTAIPVIPVQAKDPNRLNQILSTGQSLALGLGTNEGALSTTSPYRNVLLTYAAATGALPTPAPLKELYFETPYSGMANSLAGKTTEVFGIGLHALSGYCYDYLKKGSYGYAMGMREMLATFNWAKVQKYSYRVAGVSTIHGECDELQLNGSRYRGYLEEWQRDYEADAKALTQQTSIVPLFTDQMSSYTMLGVTAPRVAIAQLDAAEKNRGKIILIGPKYFLQYFDGVHLTSASYRWLGEYYGKVMRKVIYEGNPWLPLVPRHITRTGQIITVRFHVPTSPLVLDTVRVAAKAGMGFQYTNSSASPPTVQLVKVIRPDTVEITLSAIPTGTGERLRYAYSGTANSPAGTGCTPSTLCEGSARGNLRDNDSEVSATGNSLYNWAVHFDKPIPWQMGLN